MTFDGKLLLNNLKLTNYKFNYPLMQPVQLNAGPY